MRLVRVVTKTRSFACERSRISDNKSSTWARTGRISTSGSIKPVGRTTCSMICPDRPLSYADGVADT